MKGKLTKVVKGTKERPRLVVFKSVCNLSAQIIDDDAGKTLISYSTFEHKKKDKKTRNNLESAKKVGEEIGKKALAAGIKKVVFDRAGNLYHGRIAALADAARAAGLQF